MVGTDPDKMEGSTYPFHFHLCHNISCRGAKPDPSTDRIDAGSLANLGRDIMLPLLLCSESSRPCRIALGPRILGHLCLLQRSCIHEHEAKRPPCTSDETYPSSCQSRCNLLQQVARRRADRGRQKALTLMLPACTVPPPPRHHAQTECFILSAPPPIGFHLVGAVARTASCTASGSGGWE
jgi:hypothetical protein